MVDFNCDEVLFLGDMLLMDDQHRHGQQPLGMHKNQPSVTPTTTDGTFDHMSFISTQQYSHNPFDQVIPESFGMKQQLYSEVKRSPSVTASSDTLFHQSPVRTNKSSPSKGVCRIDDCSRRVRSRGLCKAHGGGRQCGVDGCIKSAHNGEYCIGHGGGKRCKSTGCANAAQSKGLCKAHGGGARCKHEGCTKSSQGRGLCRAHGGGKRCEANGCTKGAQRGSFCATHGGFRNCNVDGCPRTDRGGGFCEVHRKGRMCSSKGCKKLSRSEGMCTMHIRCWREKHGNMPVPFSDPGTIELNL